MSENIFEGKNIILGICGSIAAYKSLFLIRELKCRKANVFPVLTPSATNFITTLTVSNLSNSPVAVDMFDPDIQKKGAWHIDLVQSCDLMIIAPATASTIGKIANGICDNSLVTLATALPKTTPLLLAPAMDTTMLQNPVTQENIQKLVKLGVVVIPPAVGELSSGHYGEGRLPEVEVLLDYIETYLYFKEFGLEKVTEIKKKLTGKKFLVTAGPTCEKIDDVRFISNFSSGKMGYAIAAQANILGANVLLVSGPTKLEMHHKVETFRVVSAADMFDVVSKNFYDSDVVIMSSAVADWTPAEVFKGKLKKVNRETIDLKLKKTIDILQNLGTNKRQDQILVGFALESKQNGLKNAWEKLHRKNCDLIVLNYFDEMQSGFGFDTNKITLIGFTNREEMYIEEYPLASKNICSLIIIEKIVQLMM
ncbi:MAG: bifunctional phosphopantothenoylcysteine decarboxylase/phosphopantothenate--cysteine ligase CoaBC [Candidatus Kapaibacteriota bacterium]